MPILKQEVHNVFGLPYKTQKFCGNTFCALFHFNANFHPLPLPILCGQAIDTPLPANFGENFFAIFLYFLQEGETIHEREFNT